MKPIVFHKSHFNFLSGEETSEALIKNLVKEEVRINVSGFIFGDYHLKVKSLLFTFVIVAPTAPMLPLSHLQVQSKSSRFLICLLDYIFFVERW